MSHRTSLFSARLKELGYDIQYIGSYNGIEKELIEPFRHSLITEFLPENFAVISVRKISLTLSVS